jgi:hypothetical protein
MLNERDYNLVQALVTATGEQARIEQQLLLPLPILAIDVLEFQILEANDLISNIWSELNTGESNA